MKKVFNNLNELETFFKEEKNFIMNLMFHKLEEAIQNEMDEILVIETFCKDVFLNLNITCKKSDFLRLFTKLEEHFKDTEDYEKCAKLLEYQELLKRGTL
jgi:hypothetical protein|tara:strand:+ start:940 stop:1239 length:300 start_codon:yes stop_codon:yes gene_type:complete